MNRDYVVICNRHKSIYGGLLFWGMRTNDNDKRSFGGYTGDFDKCERYTIEEIEKSGYKFPVYGKGCLRDNWMKFDDVAIHIDRLKALGFKELRIFVR